MKYSIEKAKIITLILVIGTIYSQSSCQQQSKKGEFPDFITKNSDYFVTRIRKVPKIEKSSYRLKISGLVDKPVELSLKELKKLNMIELPLTVECIGNSPEGPLVSTAIWKGFSLYDLLISLGLDERATGVKYLAADTYYASHTMDQIKNNNVLGALYMNGKVLPPLHGFPLRFLNPGFHGVKQPAWVIEIEVVDKPVLDYWDDKGWDCSPPMAVDSTVFFPEDGIQIQTDEILEIGGAAFGGTRISKVELSSDSGLNWKKAEIKNDMNTDNVWIFWHSELSFSEKGKYSINVRATDINGNIQPEDDPERGDGENDQPILIIHVKD